MNLVLNFPFSARFSRKDSSPSSSASNSPVPSSIASLSYKPIHQNPEQVVEQVQTLMEQMPFRARWQPVENFLRLDGVALCLQVIAKAYDWTFTGRAEMVRSALDVLAICCVVPKVQQQFCERVKMYDDGKTVGINIIIGAAEGEIVQVRSKILIPSRTQGSFP